MKNISAKGLRTTLIGILSNLILAVTKSTAGYLGNSYALIADGIESLSDVISSIIVYSGLKIAVRPPDDNHPYGHGKAEPLAASVVAIALIIAAVVIIIQSTAEIINPHHAPEPFTLIVLLGVIVVKESLFKFVFKVGDTIESTAVKTDAWHHRSDAITSAAAFVGIAIALIGGDGYESADDIAALAASGIIIFNAYRLLKPAVRDLMDHSPSEKVEINIRASAKSVEGVVALDKCKIRKMGFEYYVDLDVIVEGEISVRLGHQIAHNVKTVVRLENPRVANVLIHIEPDDDERIKRTEKL
ncbi:MAG: cation diffusion facilitator family transporter [Bacteroidetes bacterium]|nr:cation diffusion facilitator family transporter [Bacteroidota bacterium]